jgi:sarcosine oxidase/L-pipecolate oxidase
VITYIPWAGSFTEGDDEAYVSQTLLSAATDGWMRDPVFKPFYHDTGYIVAASSPAALDHLHRRELPHEKTDFVHLTTAEEFRRTMPDGVLTGDFPGWEGYFKSTGAGWVHARKALVSAATEAQRLGVRYIAGSPVTGLIYENADVVGAKTADGKEHRAERTILAAGAGSDSLFDFENQLRPTAWTLAHIKMTDDEIALYKNLPVLFNIEKGFFMEPDEDKHELKICDEHPGYCNWTAGGENKSVPLAKNQIPKEAEERVRDFLRDTMPQLAQRPLSFARICWCADTPNRSFLIDRHPRYTSLVLAVGGSGHGFMHIPSVGGYIVDALEGKLDEKLAMSFRWRPETAVGRNWQDTLGRFGGPNEVMNLQKVKAWTDIAD